jgi:rhamnosyltransferase
MEPHRNRTADPERCWAWGDTGPSYYGSSVMASVIKLVRFDRAVKDSPNMPSASILLLTKNGGSDFCDCIDAIFSQRTKWPFEVVMVDSGSTDDTVLNASSHPVRIEKIRPEDFHHARTRNFAAALAQGEFLVYLSQDAIPTSENWLSALLSNFDDPSIGAVYGRQVPKRESGTERNEVLSNLYGDSRIVKQPQSAVSLGYKYYHFSSVNSAIRKDVWQATKFPDDLKVFEDIGIAKRILDSGWGIVYEPKASVYHSHDFDFKFLFRRYFDIGVVYQRLGIWDNHSQSSLRTAGWQGLRGKLSGLFRRGKARESVSAILKDIGKFTAIELGKHERRLPLAAKKRMSAYNLFD